MELNYSDFHLFAGLALYYNPYPSWGDLGSDRMTTSDSGGSQ